jgi:hypothetical protein
MRQICPLKIAITLILTTFLSFCYFSSVLIALNFSNAFFCNICFLCCVILAAPQVEANTGRPSASDLDDTQVSFPTNIEDIVSLLYASRSLS